MFIYGHGMRRIEIQALSREAPRSELLEVVRASQEGAALRDFSHAARFMSRASTIFFDWNETTPQTLSKTPPALFRERESGVLRAVYKEIVIRFDYRARKKVRDRILEKLGLAIRRVNPFIRRQLVTYALDPEVRAEQLLEMANRCMELDEVDYATPNFVSEYSVGSPVLRPEEWHLESPGSGVPEADHDLDVTAAWQLGATGQGIVVAVVDDGVDLEHPSLKPRIWQNPDPAAEDRHGRDFFVDEEDPGRFDAGPKAYRYPYSDPRKNDIHGTPCAGILAATGVGGGSHGVAPDCRILPVKIFHGSALAADERVANALRYAARNSDLISCSWFGPESQDLAAAIDDTRTLGRDRKGSLVFFAAGNDGKDSVASPARHPKAVAVGAVTDQGEHAPYSHTGPELDLVAPSGGGDRGIFTTDVALKYRGFNPGSPLLGGADGLYTSSFTGTSAAVPMAAGVAALVLSVKRDLTATQLRDLLLESAEKIGVGYDDKGHSLEFGSGRVNAGKAVEMALAG